MIKRSKELAPRLRVLEDQEYNRLLKACEEVDLIYLEKAFIFSIETTMRQGELLNAMWEHVNFERRTFFIPDTTNGQIAKDVKSKTVLGPHLCSFVLVLELSMEPPVRFKENAEIYVVKKKDALSFKIGQVSPLKDIIYNEKN